MRATYALTAIVRMDLWRNESFAPGIGRRPGRDAGVIQTESLLRQAAEKFLESVAIAASGFDARTVA